MAKSILLLGVIFQLLIGSDSLNVVENEFCNSNLQFISIFNLGDHIIFQDRAKNLWKMNQTEMGTDDHKPFQLVEKSVKIDVQMKRLLANHFDFGQSIFGFTAVDEEQAECSNDTRDEYEECLEVNTDPNIHYACFYGYKKTSLETQNIEAFKYNYSQLQNFRSKSLQKRIEDYCTNNTRESISKVPGTKEEHLIGGLQYYEPDSKHNYTLLRRQILVSADVNQSMVNLYTFFDEYKESQNKQVFTKHNTYANRIPFTTFVYVFRYNQNYGVFGCPLYCDIHTNLTRIDIFKAQGKLNYQPTALTIANIIRCPDHKVWRPNEFCSQAGFLSTFNLGKDVIFQNPGKLWRYISTGANNYGNSNLGNKLQSIRFDSDMLSFLDQYFDTSRAMHGFTFKHWQQDICNWDDPNNYPLVVQCNTHFNTFKNLPYYRACIYGEELSFEGGYIRTRNRVKAFSYTPSGLELFQSQSLNHETNEFCSTIAKSLGNDYHLTGILGDHFTNPDGNTDIYAFFRNKEGKVSYYKALLSRQADLDDPAVVVWSKIESLENAQDKSNPVDSMTYLWFHHELLGLSSQNLSDRPAYDSMSYLSSRYDWRTGTFKRLKESLRSIYNCPFSQSYSIAFMEEDKPCTDFDNVYSVLQVVKNIYHQRGRRFYRAILTEGKKRVVFDKYFTDLMNDNFDTRYKVMAVSYPLDFYEQRVLVYGTTKFNTKSLGEKIFRAFTTGWSELAPLEAVNEPDELEFGSGITFGLVDDTLKNSEFKAMGYLDQQFMLRKPQDKRFRQGRMNMIMLVLNQSHIYYTIIESRYEFPFENNFDFQKTPGERDWIAARQYQNISPLTDVFGMFVIGHKVFVTAWPPSNETRDKPRVFKIWDYREEVGREFWLTKNQYHEYWDFKEYFNCDNLESASDSSSSQKNRDDSDEDTTTFFVIMLVLLLLMACVVGVIAWDKNRTNTTEVKSDDSSKTKTSHKNVPKSETSVQKASDVKSEPKTQQMQKQSSSVQKSGSLPADDAKSVESAKSGKSSIVQIRSDLGD